MKYPPKFAKACSLKFVGIGEDQADEWAKQRKDDFEKQKEKDHPVGLSDARKRKYRKVQDAIRKAAFAQIDAKAAKMQEAREIHGTRFERGVAVELTGEHPLLLLPMDQQTGKVVGVCKAEALAKCGEWQKDEPAPAKKPQVKV